MPKILKKYRPLEAGPIVVYIEGYSIDKDSRLLDEYGVGNTNP
jgi:hypothetical protein